MGLGLAGFLDWLWADRHRPTQKEHKREKGTERERDRERGRGRGRGAPN